MLFRNHKRHERISRLISLMENARVMIIILRHKHTYADLGIVKKKKSETINRHSSSVLHYTKYNIIYARARSFSI